MREHRIATDKEMVLEATDIIRSVLSHQKGIKKTIGKWLNKILYLYYKWVE